MEILLASATILTIAILVILIGTKGKPMMVIYQFKTFAMGIKDNKAHLTVISKVLHQ